MLTWTEMFVEEHPSTRGAKLYSLLPVATSFQAAYVKINASTLYGLFARLCSVDSSREWVDEYLWTALNIDSAKKRASDSPRPFTKKTFQTHRSEIMRKVFSVAQFKTKTRKFADEEKTNGYAVSVTMIRPLTTTSVVAVEKTVPKKRMKNDRASAVKAPTKPRVKSPTELAGRDSLAKELFKLGTDYSPDVLIGIDPGMRSLVPAITVGRLRCRRRKRGGGHHRRGTRRAQRKQKVTEISTREYLHMARMNDFQCWAEQLKKQEPWYAAVTRAMPSFKISKYNLYFQRLPFVWMHLRFLLAFSAD
jgi:hypothetical protein